MRWTSSPINIFLILVFTLSCSSDSGSPADPGGGDEIPTGPVTKTVTPAGGELATKTSSGAVVQVTFPANAVQRNVSVTVRPETPQAGSWLNVTLEPAYIVFLSTGSKARPKTKAKSSAKRKASAASGRNLNLGKYMDDLRIGGYSWDDVLESSHKNIDAIADANRAVIDGYTDIAKRQYEMLKDLLAQLRKVRGERDEVVKELKKLIERARKDISALQKEATKTNSKAQKIVKKRANANMKAWKKLTAEVKKSVGGKKPAAKKKKPAGKKKSAAKKRPAAKKKSAAKKKPAAKKKAGAKRKKAA